MEGENGLAFVCLICSHDDTMHTDPIRNFDDFGGHIFRLPEIDECFRAHAETEIFLGFATIDRNRSHAHGTGPGQLVVLMALYRSVMGSMRGRRACLAIWMP
jgi:hypothetical protein